MFYWTDPRRRCAETWPVGRAPWGRGSLGGRGAAEPSLGNHWSPEPTLTTVDHRAVAAQRAQAKKWVVVAIKILLFFRLFSIIVSNGTKNNKETIKMLDQSGDVSLAIDLALGQRWAQEVHNIWLSMTPELRHHWHLINSEVELLWRRPSIANCDHIRLYVNISIVGLITLCLVIVWTNKQINRGERSKTYDLCCAPNPMSEIEIEFDLCLHSVRRTAVQCLTKRPSFRSFSQRSSTFRLVSTKELKNSWVKWIQVKRMPTNVSIEKFFITPCLSRICQQFWAFVSFAGMRTNAMSTTIEGIIGFHIPICF